MIKDNQQFFNRMHVVIDAVITAFSYLLAWTIQFTFFAQNDVGKLSFQTYMSFLVFLVPGMLLLYYAFNLYTPKRVQGRRYEAGNLIKANTIGILCLTLVMYMIRQGDFSRNMMFLFYGINIVLETLVRNLIRMFLMKIRKNGMNLKHILLVGYSRAAEEY